MISRAVIIFAFSSLNKNSGDISQISRAAMTWEKRFRSREESYLFKTTHQVREAIYNLIIITSS